jgi:ketosteroid isomerase-like protein
MAIEQDRNTITQFFALLGDGRIDEWLTLLDKNVRVSTPLAQKGTPTTFQGIKEVDARYGDARKNLEDLIFYDIDILATEDPARWVATCRSKGLFPGGIKYQNYYSWYFRMAEGLITEWVEYFDPQETMAVAAARAEQAQGR